MTILEFMSAHPILTFFLAMILGEVTIKVFRAIFVRK